MRTQIHLRKVAIIGHGRASLVALLELEHNYK